jgi:hypothetical protein
MVEKKENLHQVKNDERKDTNFNANKMVDLHAEMVVMHSPTNLIRYFPKKHIGFSTKIVNSMGKRT